VIVSGKAGVGKTVLAVRVAHHLGHHFPDGQLFMALGDCPVPSSAPTTALRRGLSALGVPIDEVPADLDEQMKLYRIRILGRRMLIIVDDATHAQQVRALTPPTPGSALIVTSRSVLAGVEGALHVECAPLSEAEAIQMVAGIIGDERVSAEPDGIRALVTLCGRLPLALRIAGTLLVLHRRWPVRVLLTRLRTRNPLEELSHGDLALRPRLTASYALLRPVEQQVFRRVGVIEGEFNLCTAAIVADLDTSTVEQAVHRLIEMHLVEATAPTDDGWGSYRLDIFLRVYARERLLAEEAADVCASVQDRALSIERGCANGSCTVGGPNLN
jgi:predicted ATPase